MEVTMSKQTLRYGILVLGLVTGVIHAVVLILYTLVTIVGFFVLNNPPFGPLGIIAKIDEVLLIVFLWLYRDK
jgi:hypothetical protein